MPTQQAVDDAPPSYEAATESRPTSLVLRRHEASVCNDGFAVKPGKTLYRQDDIILINATWTWRELYWKIVHRAVACDVCTMEEYRDLVPLYRLTIKHENLFGEPLIRDEASWEAAKSMLFRSDTAFLVFSIGFTAEEGRLFSRGQEPVVGVQKTEQVEVVKGHGKDVRKAAKEPVLLPPRHSCVIQ